MTLEVKNWTYLGTKRRAWYKLLQKTKTNSSVAAAVAVAVAAAEKE